MTSAEGTRAAYDAVAGAYAEGIGSEFAGKPLDRALLAAFLELAGPGTVADVGCGPGHVAEVIAATHPDVVGIDLSPGMIDVARARVPGVDFRVGSMLDLDAADGAWAGAALFYSIIHLDAAGRARALAEVARCVRPGGWVLIAFHVRAAEVEPGQVFHRDEWFGLEVDLDFHFLDPAEVVAAAAAAGLVEFARLERQPHADVEFASRRAYLLLSRP